MQRRIGIFDWSHYLFNADISKVIAEFIYKLNVDIVTLPHGYLFDQLGQVALMYTCEAYHCYDYLQEYHNGRPLSTVPSEITMTDYGTPRYCFIDNSSGNSSEVNYF